MSPETHHALGDVQLSLSDAEWAAILGDTASVLLGLAT
jgi:hypothetical protein